MALQTSGQITINDIVGEFGGTAPHGLNEYYGADSGVPTSGQISLSNFYGATNFVNMIATGGTIYTTGGYRYHKFTSSGTFNISAIGSVTSIQYLLVGGGGAGGGRHGAGAGAGGLSYHSGKTPATGSYTVTIGAGGTWRRSGQDGLSGNRGSNSTFWSTTSYGGGGGKSYSDACCANGGSGGGGGGMANTGYGTATQTSTGGATGYGNRGGNGGGNPDGGGGGGAGGVGSAPNNQVGGVGRQYSDWATATSSGASGYYAGGGGGGDDANVRYAGGLGGGGLGGGSNNNGNPGGVNTGGGGGGLDLVICM